MLNELVNWAFWIGLLLWFLAALASLWLWGGARRGALGHVAAGTLLLVAGSLFIHVAVINVYARMDNAYLGNGLLGLFLIIVGTSLLVGALAGYGVPAWIALVLWVAYAGFGIYGVPRVTEAFTFPDSGTLLYAALLPVGALVYMAVRGHALEAVAALVFAAVGVVVVWQVYGAGTQAFIPVETIGNEVVEPPVLGIGPFAFCLLIATTLFFAGCLIQARTYRQGRRPPTAVAGA